MIDFLHSKHQLFNGKHTQYLMVEYDEIYGVIAGESSDTIRLVLPTIKSSLKNYVFNLTQFWIKTESQNFDVTLNDNLNNLPFELNQPNYRLIRIKGFYNDTNINTFFTNETRGTPVIYMTIDNNDITDILNIRVRVIIEIYQQPVDGIGHYPLNT